MTLIDNLIENEWLKTPRIIEAFRKIKRIDFLPDDIKNLSEENEALPIGFEQTISQPLVVAFMLEKLEPKPAEKILDIGSGSGWTSALLAHIVSEGGIKLKTGGSVIAIEIISELKEFGEKNISKYNFIEKGIVKCLCIDGSKGYKEEAPYDKILCSAEAKSIPKEWKEQLKVGGKIVAPLGRAIWEIEKKKNDYVFKRYPGFMFVPLVNK